jgi:hypothetical protein
VIKLQLSLMPSAKLNGCQKMCGRVTRDEPLVIEREIVEEEVIWHAEGPSVVTPQVLEGYLGPWGSALPV